MKGLESFHKRIQVVVQGMLGPLVQAPLHHCTSHITKAPMLTSTHLCSNLPQAMTHACLAPCNVPSPVVQRNHRNLCIVPSFSHSLQL